jgi:hypothetical protein
MPAAVAADQPPVNVAPKIVVVWPHDREGNVASVGDADRVNVVVALFHYGTLDSVAAHYVDGNQRFVVLAASLNNEPMRDVARGQLRVITDEAGLTYPLWEFTDVEVPAARDPANKYFFQARLVGGSGWPSNIWVHGFDGRTYSPYPEMPDSPCR